MTAAISMISCGEEVISSQGLKAADIVSIQTEQLMSEVFYECKKDLMEKAAVETPLSEILDIKIPITQINENQIQENKFLLDTPLPKSVSSGCLSSMDWVQGTAVKPNFLEFSEVDFGTVYGMRRAYSEGDIKVRLHHFLLVLLQLFCHNYPIYLDCRVFQCTILVFPSHQMEPGGCRHLPVKEPIFWLFTLFFRHA